MTSGAEEKRPVPRSTRPRSSWPLPGSRSRLVLVGAAVVALALGLVIWLLLRDNGDSNEAARAPAEGVSVRDLAELQQSVRHPVYWAGPRPGLTYELSRTKDGRIYIRYLPANAKAGNTQAKYLTVGTYPQQHAFATLRASAKTQGSRTIHLPGGGLAFQYKSRPTSVYLAYPRSDYQIEVFDPSAKRALELVAAGHVKPVGLPPQTSGAEAVSVQQLKELAVSLGHPLYWAGAKSGYTYELTRTRDGSVYVRYLPHGVHIGAHEPRYLTVGTYPQKGALGMLKATAAKSHVPTITLNDGGLAFVDAKHPTSIYIAYPNVDLQVEVFDPAPPRARRLVTSGQIAPVR